MLPGPYWACISFVVGLIGAGCPSATTCDVANDADCDGVLATIDCDDADPENTASRVGDADCDGVPAAIDCDDGNPQVTSTSVEDADCDAVPTTIDCDDSDPLNTASRVGDADCDGVHATIDCDDANPQVTSTSVEDADCDAVPTTIDCDDNDPLNTASRVGDADCDGVPTTIDCDDDDSTNVASSENLLANSGFETLAPGEVGLLGQGIVPAPWQALALTPDTYTNDGSFGLPLDYLENFTGVEAFAGIRWAAAWGAAGESLGQILTQPLDAGVVYVVGGYFHMALRADLAIDSRYAVDLIEPGGNSVTVGTFAAITTPGAWEYREFSFQAPNDAADRTLFGLRSVEGYAGIDELELRRSCP